eukprot:7389677-Prymnesium_polylepis.1
MQRTYQLVSLRGTAHSRLEPACKHRQQHGNVHGPHTCVLHLEACLSRGGHATPRAECARRVARLLVHETAPHRSLCRQPLLQPGAPATKACRYNASLRV